MKSAHYKLIRADYHRCERDLGVDALVAVHLLDVPKANDFAIVVGYQDLCVGFVNAVGNQPFSFYFRLLLFEIAEAKVQLVYWNFGVEAADEKQMVRV